MRARIQIKGTEYNLGVYDTRVEVDAAKEGAIKMYSVLSAAQPKPTTRPAPAKPPGLHVITHLVEQGTYDSNADGLHTAAWAFVRRDNMVRDGIKRATAATTHLSLEDMQELASG